MKTLQLCVMLLILTACAPVAGPTLAPPIGSPGPTPDALAEYRHALKPADEHDLDQLNRLTRYDLTLTYDAKAPALSGSEDVQYYNQQSVPLNEIYFRLFANYPNSDSKITVTHLAISNGTATSTLEVQNTALKVTLPQPLAPGAMARLHLDFTVTIPRNSQQHYADLTSTDTVTTMPSIYPLIPAYDSRGWHIELPPPYGDLVYADTSMYAVTMTLPSAMNVIASGSTVGSQDNGDGTKTVTMVGAPMRDFDLNVSDTLQKVSEVVEGTTVNSWYEPADADAGKNVLKYATQAISDFSRFGPYPYSEFDIVESPTTAGGIEYPGVIVVNRGLYGDSRAQTSLEFDTVHEVAHQWWYGVVGDDQVNDPWLDEALAQYSTLLYEEDTYGQSRAQTVLRDYFQRLYQRAKAEGRDMAVNLPVSAYSEGDYDAIVYGKGPLFFDAIRKKMGADKFILFLKTYYERYRYKVAFPEDLMKSAEDACGCSLQDEYKQWILAPQ